MQAGAAAAKPRRVDEVVAQVAEAFGMKPDRLLERTHAGDVVTARRFAWYVLVVRWNHSQAEIGKLMGYDSTTVRTGVMAMAESLKTDRDLQSKARAFGV